MTTAVALCLLAGLFVFRLGSGTTRWRPGAASEAQLRQLRATSLRDVRRGIDVRLTFDSQFTLVVFLSAGDCSTLLDETSRWNDLARLARSDDAMLNVIGIVVRSTGEEAFRYAEDFGAAFTLLHDTTGALPENLRLGHTPTKFLVDSAVRTILVSGPSADDAEFVKEVARTVFGRPAIRQADDRPLTPHQNRRRKQ